MSIVDVAAMNASLANDYGPGRGPAAADWHDLELWFGDPRQAGAAELTSDGGYTPARINPVDWSTPAGGAIQARALFADATDAFSGPATHWALRGSDGNLWDADALTKPLLVAGPGLIPPVIVIVYHSDTEAEADT